MVKFVLDHKDWKPELDTDGRRARRGDLPAGATFLEHKNYTTAIDINPHYITPKMLQFRLQKIMDEYVAGCATYYMTNEKMLDAWPKRSSRCSRRTRRKMRAKDLHELLRAWENYHRILTVEAHMKHIQFREETPLPGLLLPHRQELRRRGELEVLRQLGLRQERRRSGPASSASTSTWSTSRSCSRRRAALTQRSAACDAIRAPQGARSAFGRPAASCRMPTCRHREMIEARHDTSMRRPPFPESPVAAGDARRRKTIQFQCRKGIACWNACCSNIDISLTPYDILRLKRRLGIASADFLQRYTVPYEMEKDGIAGVKLRPVEGGTACQFMKPEGCGVYEDRPTACRYYPVALLSMRTAGRVRPTATPTRWSRSRTASATRSRARMTIDEYRAEQGLPEYDELARGWRQLILKKKSLGPDDRQALEAQPAAVLHDLLRHRPLPRVRRQRRLQGALRPARRARLHDDPLDDVALMQFGFRFLRQVLFGEVTIPLRAEARSSAARAPRRRSGRTRGGRAARPRRRRRRRVCRPSSADAAAPRRCSTWRRCRQHWRASHASATGSSSMRRRTW